MFPKSAVSIFLLAFAVLYCNASIRGRLNFRGVPTSVFEGPGPFADTYVTIKNGTLKGKTSTTLSSQTMYVYQSIPYAKAPVGDLRFRVSEISCLSIRPLSYHQLVFQ